MKIFDISFHQKFYMTYKMRQIRFRQLANMGLTTPRDSPDSLVDRGGNRGYHLHRPRSPPMQLGDCSVIPCRRLNLRCSTFNVFRPGNGSPSATWMGDCLRAGKPSGYVAIQSTQPSALRGMVK